MRRRKGSSRAGFTLIELMIVVAIIGVLAAIAIPKFADLIRKAQEGATKGKLSSMRSTLHIYYADNEGLYPTDDLTCLVENAKYTFVIPEITIPGYHPKNNTVQNNDTLGASMGAVDTGMWLYWNWPADQPARHWGEVWVGCTHTDVKGIIWSTF